MKSLTRGLRGNVTNTFGLWRGWSWESFLAAASIEFAALSSSVSAITVGSYGSTNSEPANK